MASHLRCLVTGATGYIGGRLVPELLAAGYTVRCMARDPGKLTDRPWSDDIEVAKADVSDPAALRRALADCDVAYYLIHSLGTGSSFEQRDRDAARAFADAAREADVKRIVYLGGMISGQEGDLSPHLRSRAEVGDILLDSGVPTAALQAAVIIGSGSASFEMLRYLTERLPAMITPKWVTTRIQPIAVRDVLRYLVDAATLPADVNRRFDIGGPDVLTYADMMRRYAAVAKLPPRLLVSVPVLTPSLSSHWVGLVTPVPSGLARPLVESLRVEVVAAEHDIAQYIPDPPEGLLPLDRAIELALTHTREGDVSTRWSSASIPGAPSDPLPSDPEWAGGSLYVDERISVVDAPPEALWRVIEGIGGTSGARCDGPSGRRGRPAPRPAGPGAPAPRRRAGLLAGGGDCPGRAAAAAGGDEAARAGLAGAVRRPGRRRPDHLPATGDLPAPRPDRARLLALDLAVPRHRVRWHAA